MSKAEKKDGFNRWANSNQGGPLEDGWWNKAPKGRIGQDQEGARKRGWVFGTLEELCVGVWCQGLYGNEHNQVSPMGLGYSSPQTKAGNG